MDLWKLFVRRRALVLACILCSAAIGLTIFVVSQRRYQAVGVLQVQRESIDGLGLSSLMGESGASDALDGNITMQTEATILRSDTLALHVIDDLNLESTEDFKPHFDPTGWITRVIGTRGVPDPEHASLENAPARRSHALRAFSKSLSVKPVPGTRLIEVSYISSDPKMAAEVVNHLIQTLTDFSFQTRYNATSQAANWLGGQLSDLRKQSEDLQSKVVELQRDSGVFTLGAGTEVDGKSSAAASGMYSTVLDQLQQATASLSQAESNRIMRRAIYEAAKSGDADLVSGLVGSNGSSSMSAGMANSLSLMQGLRLQRATLQGQFDETASKFGPAYPKLDEMKANLASVDSAIKQELQRMADRARSDYEVSQSVEDGVRQLYQARKHDADRLNDKTIEYTIARQEAEQSRTLYQTLLTHLKEAGALAGLRSSNISIVDPARVPSKPAKPNLLFLVAGSLACGCFFGISSAVIVDLRDNKIRDLNEIDAQTERASIGVLPFYREEKLPARSGSIVPRDSRLRIMALDEPRSSFSEALRSLRTSLLLSGVGAPPQVVVTTSSMAGEGKTTVSVNLAVLFAQHGKRILLVDGDLRRPTIHKIFEHSCSKGLSTLLAGETAVDDESLYQRSSQVRGLDVICAGPIPPYPSELLGSSRMKSCLEFWKKRYDFIIIDGAPALPVTDSVILSEMADATLLVARFAVTERQALERSYSVLRRSSGRNRNIDIVVNAVESSAQAYHDYYGYAPYTYGQKSEELPA